MWLIMEQYLLEQKSWIVERFPHIAIEQWNDLISLNSPGASTGRKIVICVGSCWIMTDLAISLLQSAIDTDLDGDERNVFGPFTYLSARWQKNRAVGANPGLLGLRYNIQFTSSKGLARNMIGGLAIGIAAGVSAVSIFNAVLSVVTQTETKQLIASPFTVICRVSPWSLYVFNSSIFYCNEYLWAAIFQPNNLSIDSFMLYTHSNAFHIAMCFSAIEYWTEYVLFPSTKTLGNIHLYGLGLVIIGQLIRTVAQFTAKMNFSHQIAEYKKETHELVKHGIYGYLRHPSYFGFFYWSVGTQLLLANPMSTVAFAVGSWSFFANRIPYEEQRLINFFGDDYLQYRRETYIGIPFI